MRRLVVLLVLAMTNDERRRDHTDTLSTADFCQPGSRVCRQCATMPACDSVKLVNTPTAYSGISASRLP